MANEPKAQHTNIAQALAAAQAQMGKALKQTSNPHFKSKYADLGSVMDACMPALSANDFAVVHMMQETELGRIVITRFMHASGESLDCPVPLILGKNDMQGLGSAITYARRYGLMMLAGIAPEDDDGNAAVAATDVRPPSRSWAQTVIDELPASATERDKAEALRDALVSLWQRKKTEQQLSNEWDRRKALIDNLGERFPTVRDEIIDAYETQMMQISGTFTSAAE